MKFIKALFLSSMLTLGFGSFTSANAGSHECGDVTIAEMTWQSAAVLAHLDAQILSTGNKEIHEKIADYKEKLKSKIVKANKDLKVHKYKFRTN